MYGESEWFYLWTDIDAIENKNPAALKRQILIRTEIACKYAAWQAG